MIVTGILIALGLEAAIESNHHRNLVHEAQENLAREMSDNKKSVDGALANLGKQEQDLRNALRWARELTDKRKTDVHELNLGFNIPTLSAASWRTAEVTGALGYMKYADVQKYSEVYDTQELFTRLHALKLERFSAAFSLVQEGDPEKASMAELERFRQQIRSSLGDLIAERSLAEGLSKLYAQVLGAKPHL